MPFAGNVVSVLVASPSDVQAERDALRTAMWDFNDEHASALQVVLLPILWKTHARPELGTDPQTLLDQQIVDGADVVTGVFWTRAGSRLPDGTFATVHELERLVAAGKPALLYFSSQPAVPSMIDPDQLLAVQAIKARAQAWGLYGEYNSVAGLVERARRDLLRTVRDRLSLPTPTAPSSVSAAAARPIASVRRERLQGFDSKGRPRTNTNYYLVISNVRAAQAAAARRAAGQVADSADRWVGQVRTLVAEQERRKASASRLTARSSTLTKRPEGPAQGPGRSR